MLSAQQTRPCEGLHAQATRFIIPQTTICSGCAFLRRRDHNSSLSVCVACSDSLTSHSHEIANLLCTFLALSLCLQRSHTLRNTIAIMREYTTATHEATLVALNSAATSPTFGTNRSCSTRNTQQCVCWATELTVPVALLDECGLTVDSASVTGLDVVEAEESISHQLPCG